MKRKWLGRGAVLVALVLLVRGDRWGLGGIRRSMIRSRCSRARRSKAPADVAVSVNLFWVVIGAVLVIFMQAGFALVETGFSPGQERGARVLDELRDLRPRVSGLLPRGLRVHVRRLQLPGPLRLDKAVGDTLIGSGNGCSSGRAASALTTSAGSARTRRSATDGGVLPLHGTRSWTRRPRSRPVRWPSAGSGRPSSAGACSAARSTTRSSAAGRGAAAGWPARQQHAPRLRLRGLRRLRRRARHGRCRGLGRRARARSSARQVRTRREAAHVGGAQHPDGDAGDVHPVCSAGSASTPRRRSRPPTSGSRSSPSNTAHRGRLRRHRSACSRPCRRLGKPDPGNDGQRHARRAGRDHGAVRVRAAMGGSRDRHRSPASS